MTWDERTAWEREELNAMAHNAGAKRVYDPATGLSAWQFPKWVCPDCGLRQKRGCTHVFARHDGQQCYIKAWPAGKPHTPDNQKWSMIWYESNDFGACWARASRRTFRDLPFELLLGWVWAAIKLGDELEFSYHTD